MTNAMRSGPPAVDSSKPGALHNRAKTLMDEGRFEEAEPLFLLLTQQFPEIRRYRSLYVRTAIEACRPLADTGPRRGELTRYVVENIAAGGTDDDRAQAMWLLSLLCARPEGREILTRAARFPSSLKDIQTGIQFIPRFFEPGTRGALWSRMLSQLDEIAASEISARPGFATELKLRLLLALERYSKFTDLFDARRDRLEDSKFLPAMQRIRERLDKPRADVFLEPKVFGIGLSRTGTTSLAEALTLLGIDTAHWTNPLTMQIISEIEFFLFGACTDCSVSPEFEKLYYLYPNARLVLTRRPVEGWVRSFWKHHERTSWARNMDEFRRAFNERTFPEAVIEFALYTESPDVAQSYRSFENRVQTFFADKPKDKLLNLDMTAGQGWPELCAFLGRPVPDIPFPRLNLSPVPQVPS